MVFNMTDKKYKLVVIAGPTAVGKSDLSIELAKKINGEVISADSMQVYRGMDIGTAKLTKEEMCGINHYLIDVLEPTEEFNVSIFKNMAEEAIKEIVRKGKIPILVGGTGFYIQALLKNVEFSDEAAGDESIRKELELIAETEEGRGKLYKELLLVDPKSTEKIHKNNKKRIIRALEYYKLTGKKISEHNEEESEKDYVYNCVCICLTDERQVLYDRINKRVDKMVSSGLEAEVRRVIGTGVNADDTSMQGIGYREMLSYINGGVSLTKCIEDIKKNTRHFAKRQLTWFKNQPKFNWIDISQCNYDKEKILEKAELIVNTELRKGEQ